MTCGPVLPTWLPGATPTLETTPSSCATVPSAAVPLGPTQIATGTVDAWMWRASATNWSSEITMPVLLSWSTRATAPSDSASFTEEAMKSARTGSSSPLIFTTSTLSGVFAAAAARLGARRGSGTQRAG